LTAGTATTDRVCTGCTAISHCLAETCTTSSDQTCTTCQTGYSGAQCATCVVAFPACYGSDGLGGCTGGTCSTTTADGCSGAGACACGTGAACSGANVECCSVSGAGTCLDLTHAQPTARAVTFVLSQADCNAACGNACTGVDVPWVVGYLSGTTTPWTPLPNGDPPGEVAFALDAGTCSSGPRYRVTVSDLIPGTGYDYQFVCPGGALFNDPQASGCGASSCPVTTLAASTACPAGLTLDGNIGEWAGHDLTVVNLNATNWGASNALRSLSACVDANNLYLAIDGQVEYDGSAHNVIALYLQVNPGWAPTNPAPTSPADLGDFTGEPDTALSTQQITSWPTGFTPDWGWGTDGMLGKDSSGPITNIGLRDFLSTGWTNFGWPSPDSAQCNSTSCEIELPWTLLFGHSSPATPPSGTTRIYLFARLVSEDGSAMSDNTLPQDQPGAPGTVTALMAFDVTF
jgi:hypothetical protein